MESNVLLSVQGITKDFPGTRALSNVSINIGKGEIHGLIGENGAGKSTLSSVISGVIKPTSGKIFFDGKEVDFSSPNEAQNAGIGFVHQELSLCSHLSVSENIFMGRLPKNKSGLIDYRKLNQDSADILKVLKSTTKPTQKVAELNVAEQQVVEIAKSLCLNCKLIILDEPTSSLTKDECEVLYDIIAHLKSQGISIIYISHRLNEVFNQCDKITILRDGVFITTVAKGAAGYDYDEIISKMVGRKLGELYTQKSTDIGEELLRIEDFSSKGVFKDISFTLKRGEILGFSGLIGAGRTEVMRALCGIDHKDKGTVYLEGKKINIKTYEESIKYGIGYLTEDRKLQGLFLNLTVSDNISAASLYKVKNGMLIDNAKAKKLSQNYVKELNIKVSDLGQTVESLSGGNQQKIMIAKWMAIDPKIIIMDEPTRGIDIGAKVEIYKLLRDLSNRGVGVIMISSELPEIIGMCDRVIVMHEGSITGIVEGDDNSELSIMRYASGKTA